MTSVGDVTCARLVEKYGEGIDGIVVWNINNITDGHFIDLCLPGPVANRPTPPDPAPVVPVPDGKSGASTNAGLVAVITIVGAFMLI